MTELDPELAARQQLSELFEAHHAELLAYARRRGAREADAEEIVAETFVIAWRRMGRLQPGAERAWLFGIARRAAANHLRGLSRREMRAAELTEQAPAGGAMAGLDADLRAVLEELREGDRELLELAAWEELTPADLAMLLDISPNAAAIRLHRARQRFVQAMIQHSDSARDLKESGWMRTFRRVRDGLNRGRRNR